MFFFGEVLTGKRFGNAQAEVGTKHVRDIRTTLTRPLVEQLRTSVSKPRSWLLSTTTSADSSLVHKSGFAKLHRDDLNPSALDGPINGADVQPAGGDADAA